MRKLLIYLLTISAQMTLAQTNCAIYKDASHQKGCALYTQAIEYPQGSRQSQELFLASLKACPDFAPTLDEMSVPYLKRGEFYTWKLLMDRAVAADPMSNLATRGWCLFKFLKDDAGAYADLERLDKMTHGQPGYTGDGDYDLRIILGLCQSRLGDRQSGLESMNRAIADHEKHGVIGLFDYLQRGILELEMGKLNNAVRDFRLEQKRYAKLADTEYYLGLAALRSHEKQQALIHFKNAHVLFTRTGYHHTDPYCEVPGQVYLADIDRHIR